jgi:hypothetical protein
MKQGTQVKKSYLHAKDNAVSSIGKVIKFQGANINVTELVAYWLTYMPIKKDKGEAQIMNDLYCDIIAEKPELILGANYANLETVVQNFAFISDKKYITDETRVKLANIMKGMSVHAELGPAVEKIAASKLKEEERLKIKKVLECATV